MQTLVRIHRVVLVLALLACAGGPPVPAASAQPPQRQTPGPATPEKQMESGAVKGNQRLLVVNVAVAYYGKGWANPPGAYVVPPDMWRMRPAVSARVTVGDSQNAAAHCQNRITDGHGNVACGPVAGGAPIRLAVSHSPSNGTAWSGQCTLQVPMLVASSPVVAKVARDRQNRIVCGW